MPKLAAGMPPPCPQEDAGTPTKTAENKQQTAYFIVYKLESGAFVIFSKYGRVKNNKPIRSRRSPRRINDGNHPEPLPVQFFYNDRTGPACDFARNVYFDDRFSLRSA